MSGAEKISFNELLEKARAGDRGAWQELFDRLAGDEAEGEALHAMARKILPGSDRARDLVDSLDLMQSALRSGWLDASQFQGQTEKEFFGWIRAILRRKLARATRRKRPFIGLNTRQEEHPADDQDGAENPLKGLIRTEMKNRLSEAIAKLPDDLRAVITLRLEGKKSPEIASALDLSPEAVRKRESRAASRLRELLSRNEEI